MTQKYSDDVESLGGAWYSTLKLMRVPWGPVWGSATPIDSLTGFSAALGCGDSDTAGFTGSDCGWAAAEPFDPAPAVSAGDGGRGDGFDVAEGGGDGGGDGAATGALVAGGGAGV